MARVVVTRPLLDGATDPLGGHDVEVWSAPSGPAALSEACVSSDAIVAQLTDRFDAVTFGTAPRVRVVANVAVGYDNIDVDAATRAGVLVCNTQGVLDETTADLAFALILSACRAMSDAERDLRSGGWTGFEFGRYLGVDVHGATLGIVGYGRIGRAVARRAAGFSMTVLHTSRTPTGEAGNVTLDELLERSDIVSLHVPLRPETRHLIGAAQLARMSSHAVLVNTSRGPVVDELALARALEEGTIFGAGLDVFDGEPVVNRRLLHAPRVALLPHIGSATYATRLAMARLACESAALAVAGEIPPTALNPGAWDTRG